MLVQTFGSSNFLRATASSWLPWPSLVATQIPLSHTTTFATWPARLKSHQVIFFFFFFMGQLRAISREYHSLPVGAGPLAADFPSQLCLFQTFAITDFLSRQGFFINQIIYGTIASRQEGLRFSSGLTCSPRMSPLQHSLVPSHSPETGTLGWLELLKCSQVRLTTYYQKADGINSLVCFFVSKWSIFS